MKKDISEYINKVCDRVNLTEQESAYAFLQIMDGQVSDIKITAFLVALKVKGETIEEIAGAAKVLRSKSKKIVADGVTIDTCGTGGDASGTLNISTVVALVLAACGIKVAKHGNKAISSKSGSADVLSQFGVNLNADIEVIQKCLNEIDICFMMAPNFHSAMKNVAKVRSELGVRTIFNILGPLINPASVNYQLLGVYKKSLVEPMANVLKNLGEKRAWVVNGNDGVDELSITGPSFVAELKDGIIKTFEINPEDAGLNIYNIEDIKGQDSAYNAKQMEKLLLGEGLPAYRDVVLFNSAAALLISGKVFDIKEGVKIASEALNSGKANEKLMQLVEKTN